MIATQPTLVNELQRNQQEGQEGLAGQSYEKDMLQQQQLKAIMELLAQNTPPEDIVKAGYSIEMVKVAIQMLARQERVAAEKQKTLGIGETNAPVMEQIPVNESLAGGNVMM